MRVINDREVERIVLK
jgi:hypothetical protein